MYILGLVNVLRSHASEGVCKVKSDLSTKACKPKNTGGTMFFSRLIIKQHLKHDVVAIVSLMVALSGLFYDTWRDHHNQVNLNKRNAAFELLRDLAELQTVVNYSHFEEDHQRGNPIDGWKYVLLVRDLSHLLPHDTMQQSQTLYDVWADEWENLGKNNESEQHIGNQIAAARANVLMTIDELQ